MSQEVSQPYQSINDDLNYTLELNQTKSKKKNNCCLYILIVSFLSCLIFWILFPRVPHASFKYLTIYNTTLFADFKFKNSNNYNVNWKDINMDLYWIPYQGQSVGPICYGDNDTPCETKIYVDNMCAIKLGEFKKIDKFNTKAHSRVSKSLKLTYLTNQQLACTYWMILNPYQNKPQFLMTKGSVQSSNMLQDYHKIEIPKEYYEIYVD